MMLSSSYAMAEQDAMVKQGEAILADTQAAVTRAAQFFTFRGITKRVSHRVSQFDTGEALLATGGVAAALAGIMYGAPKIPWATVGQSVVSVGAKIGGMGRNWWITLGILGLAMTIFLTLEAHSDAAYCWCAIRLMDALSYELVLDDFFADRVEDAHVRAYIIANFDQKRPVLAAVRHYQETSKVLNKAQEMLATSSRSSNTGIVQQSRTFLDLLRRFEGQIERKLEYIYRVMGHEYELEKLSAAHESAPQHLPHHEMMTSAHSTHICSGLAETARR
jgi:hypothetical protein